WVGHTHWKDSVAIPDPKSTAAYSQQESTLENSQQAAARAHSLMSGHRPAHYVLFGSGEFPAFECAGLLKQGSYQGWLSLEWEKMWHPDIEDPEIALPQFITAMSDIWQAAEC